MTRDMAEGAATLMKNAVTDAFKEIFAGLKSKEQVPQGAPVGPGSGGAGDYQGGNYIIDMAQNTPGTYMWCEKFVGDVMARLGLNYWRAPSAIAHARAQPLNPGYGPTGSIQFYDWDDAGHVAFNVDGNGTVFGTLDTATGTGFARIGLPSLGWTQNPRWSGGPINEPVMGRGLWTNQSYSFGEHGPEYVVPQGSRVGGSGGGITLQGDIYVTVETQPGQDPASIAQKTVDKLWTTVQRSGVAG
jgi:hypothetical protein